MYEEMFLNGVKYPVNYIYYYDNDGDLVTEASIEVGLTLYAGRAYSYVEAWKELGRVVKQKKE